MTNRSWTRRLGATLVLTTTLVTLVSVSGAVASPEDPEPEVVPAEICPIDWRRGSWHVKQLIRCVAEHHGVSIRTSLYVASLESHFRPRAYNAASCARGIFQHLCRYWAGRAKAYGFPNRSAFNARANIFVTMRMVKRYGWAPWGV